MEAFLLDSIEMVKSEVARRRAEEDKHNSVRARSGRLPVLSAVRPSNLPSSAEEHVDIRDLTWDDRERVLRLLFAKINNAAPFEPMPPHPLHEMGAADVPPSADDRLPGHDDTRKPRGGSVDTASFFVTQSQAEQA